MNIVYSAHVTMAQQDDRAGTVNTTLSSKFIYAVRFARLLCSSFSKYLFWLKLGCDIPHVSNYAIGNQDKG